MTFVTSKVLTSPSGDVAGDLRHHRLLTGGSVAVYMNEHNVGEAESEVAGSTWLCPPPVPKMALISRLHTIDGRESPPKESGATGKGKLTLIKERIVFDAWVRA